MMKNKYFLLSDDVLFHFTDRITFLEKILPSNFLLLNQLKNTNDPQEYKKYEFGATTHRDLASDLKIRNEINDYYKNFVQIVCFCTWKKEEIRNTWQKSKIWSDFGDGHKGICLILSKTAIELELDKLNIYYDIKNVTYNFKPTTLPTPDVDLYHEIGSQKYCNQFVKDNKELNKHTFQVIDLINLNHHRLELFEFFGNLHYLLKRLRLHKYPLIHKFLFLYYLLKLVLV